MFWCKIDIIVNKYKTLTKLVFSACFLLRDYWCRNIYNSVVANELSYSVLCAGNHEYYTGDVDHWFHLLNTSLGVNVLHNSCQKIMNKASTNFFVIAGTDDIQADNLGLD